MGTINGLKIYTFYVYGDGDGALVQYDVSEMLDNYEYVVENPVLLWGNAQVFLSNLSFNTLIINKSHHSYSNLNTAIMDLTEILSEKQKAMSAKIRVLSQEKSKLEELLHNK